MKTAKVTKVPPTPPAPFYKIEASISEKDAKHLCNWLCYIRDTYGSHDEGLVALRKELESAGL